MTDAGYRVDIFRAGLGSNPVVRVTDTHTFEVVEDNSTASVAENKSRAMQKFLGFKPPAGNLIDEALAELKTVLTSKRADYATEVDPFSNFSEAASIASVLRGHELDDKDALAILIGVKIARIGNLERSGKTPENEPLVDSLKDFAGYASLLFAHGRSQK